MNPFAPLMAADLGDLIKVVIVLAFILVPAIMQLVAKWQEAQRGPAKGGRAGRPKGKPQAGGQAGQGGGLEDEIGEFLRRAARGRRGEAAGPKAPNPQPPPRRVEPPRRLVERPVEVQVIPDEEELGERLAKQVSQDLPSDRLAEHAEQLGSDVVQADERREEQRHEKFDHQLGQLGHRRDKEEAETAAAQSALPIPAAAGLPALVADAESLRQASMLNEILTRPEHRWS